MLRKALLAAVALIALSAPVQAETNGSIGAGFSSTEFTGGDVENTSVEAAIFHGFGNGFGLQGELAFDSVESTGGFDNDYAQYALHGLYRTDTWAAGLVVGHSEVYNADIDIYGVEGAFYFDRFTLAGSYLRGDADFNQEFDRFGIDGRYFITDNFSVGAGLASETWDAGVIDADWVSYDLNAEYRFGALPIAASVGYGSSDFDTQSDVDTWRIGLRWDIGTNSLIDRDRNGASFDDVDRFLEESYRLD